MDPQLPQRGIPVVSVEDNALPADPDRFLDHPLSLDLMREPLDIRRVNLLMREQRRGRHNAKFRRVAHEAPRVSQRAVTALRTKTPVIRFR